MSTAKNSSVVAKSQETKPKKTKKIVKSKQGEQTEADKIAIKVEKINEAKRKRIAAAAKILEKKQAGLEAVESVNYLARSVIQATLPHSDPKTDIYTRKDGNFTLMLRGNPQYGLPYGVIPRLLLAWITTEAVRTKSPELIIGESLMSFLEQLGLSRNGGKRGDITRLKNQLRRLLSCTISFSYSDKFRTFVDNTTPIKHAEIWWLPMTEEDEKKYEKSKNKISPASKNLFESTLILSTDFFQEIIRNPIPVRMETLAALKGSAMDLDIYFWLTMQNGRPGATERLIPYELLQEQFGAAYPKTLQGKRNFKKKLLEAIERVALVYESAGLLKDEGKLGLRYVPGLPDIPPKN